MGRHAWTGPDIAPTAPVRPVEPPLAAAPLADVVKIVDARGHIVPVNAVGELCTRGYHVFMGYLGEEGKEREAIRNNWYHTGASDFLAKAHIARLESRHREQNQRCKGRRRANATDDDRATEAKRKREARRRLHSTPAEQFPGTLDFVPPTPRCPTLMAMEHQLAMQRPGLLSLLPTLLPST
ncbi:hypothetical protein HPB47_008265 [Ixodes persulcatus]|uniref:Uncharacterized protein n=1 Tax=Ixodes persulcatus TaxID=34615 RepID=A0AC60P5J0_IXOPE|nr:hypothetical protein HPB47_008265 [Ixodes persulcatus]